MRMSTTTRTTRRLRIKKNTRRSSQRQQDCIKSSKRMKQKRRGKRLRKSRKSVRVFGEEGNCIVCLEMRADELMRRLISGELTNYSVVRTSPELLQKGPRGEGSGTRREQEAKTTGKRRCNHEKTGRTGKDSYPNNLTGCRTEIYKAASCTG
jgi:hypothetical protein